MKTILAVIGTRPEAIKMAPVVQKLQQTPGVRARVCLTGQHREMLEPMLRHFEITPQADLDLMHPGQSLADLTARALARLNAHYAATRPDLVLVQGDTSTVLAATLAAFYQRIPVGHVEAGLRTGDLNAPWPEEANRVLTSRLAALHFAPTPRARDALLREGVAAETVSVTGNTGIDALLWTLAHAGQEVLAIASDPRIVLITAHRRESFGAPLEALCEAIADLAARFPQVRFVYPVHPNPEVLAPVNRILDARSDPRLAAGNVSLIEPLPYPEFVRLMASSTLILTDSGGIQEEAPTLGKPVLVLRETTERPEAVEAGTVRLVGTDRAAIVRETARLLTDPQAYAVMARTHNPYGDGQAATRIVAGCLSFLDADNPPRSPGPRMDFS